MADLRLSALVADSTQGISIEPRGAHGNTRCSTLSANASKTDGDELMSQ
jgi:hypothetical protein